MPSIIVEFHDGSQEPFNMDMPRSAADGLDQALAVFKSGPGTLSRKETRFFVRGSDELREDIIYVFTPQGKPQHATKRAVPC